MTIEIIGYKGLSLTSKIIQKFTFGKFSHVEWLLDIDTLEGFGAFEKIGGVDFTGPHLHKKNTPYVVWSIPVCTKQYAMFAEFMYSQRYKKYDWPGILGFPTFKDNNDPNKWFCSEILTVGCKEVDIPLFNWEYTKPGVTSPNRFVLSPLFYGTKIKEGKT